MKNNSELMFYETRGGFEQGFHNKRAKKGHNNTVFVRFRSFFIPIIS
jgi:hypothetical protein